MARVLFTQEEIAQVDSTCDEFDPASHELTARYIHALYDPDERAHLKNHLRAALRAELVVGLVARAAADACRDSAGAEEIAAEQFVEDDSERARSGITGARRFREGRRWQYNLGYLSQEAIETYRILRKFYGRGPVHDGLYPMDEAFFALLDLAHDRMFGTLDKEYERLLELHGSVSDDPDD